MLKAEEAKVKILEVTGDRVDNKSKLEVIQQEEAIIRREKEERKKEEEAEKLAKEKVLADAAAEAEVKFRSVPTLGAVFTLDFQRLSVWML